MLGRDLPTTGLFILRTGRVWLACVQADYGYFEDWWNLFRLSASGFWLFLDWWNFVSSVQVDSGYFVDWWRVSEVFRKNKKGGVIIPDDNIT